VQTQGANPTILRARAWRSGAPADRLVGRRTDSTTALQAAGSLGIRSVNDSGAATRLELDELLVTRLP